MLIRTSVLAAAILLANAQTPNTFEILSVDPGVSAQQLFVASEDIVYIVDKVENNPAQVAGHPAWAAEVNLKTMTSRPMDILTNSFCAGGISLGDGRWINAGGNNPVGSGGVTVQNDVQPYEDSDGGLALRVLTPCTNGNCQWSDNSKNYMNSRRWYLTSEVLSDGVAMLIGGDFWGGFVNNEDGSQNNPTYEFFPKSTGKSQDFPLTFLNQTLPANLYPLTWMMPSGQIFMQANWGTMNSNVPASGATIMLTQNAANNWTAPVLFCGGADYQSAEWEANAKDNAYFRDKANSASCVSINPDADNPQWQEEDDLPQARSMGSLIALPDGRFLLANGIASGVAGYDSTGWPYGTDPIYEAYYYDPSQSSGSRWTLAGKANLPRLYHSSASLLADGSVLVAGSNPYADFQTNGSVINAGPNSTKSTAEWWSETRLEKFYPDYYYSPRPAPTGIPQSISYGGDAFQVQLSANDIAGLVQAEDAKFVIIRTGFSTHAMNMGQRRVELETSLASNSDGSAVLTVAPLPANAHVLAPGPAFAFVVIAGVPSQGQLVMIGNGEIGVQPLGAYPTLPTSSFTASPSASSIAAAASRSAVSNAKQQDSSASLGVPVSVTALLLSLLAIGASLF